MSKDDKEIKVYFDGDCLMCRTFVPWLEDSPKNKKPEDKPKKEKKSEHR